MVYAWSRFRMGGRAIAQSPVMHTTVPEARLAQRGYQSFTRYYSTTFHGARTVRWFAPYPPQLGAFYFKKSLKFSLFIRKPSAS